MIPELYGVVLAGGSSSRMHQDKASLVYDGRTQLMRAAETLEHHVLRVFVSIRADQTGDPLRNSLPLIVDAFPGEGPLVGIRSAFAQYPNFAWLVLACDLPFLSNDVIATLVARRDSNAIATAYRSAQDGGPEPLCAIWEPGANTALGEFQGGSARQFLARQSVRVLELPKANALEQANTPEDYNHARDVMRRTQR